MNDRAMHSAPAETGAPDKVAEVETSTTASPAEIPPAPGAGAPAADPVADPDADTQAREIPDGTAVKYRDNLVLRGHMIHVLELDNGACVIGVASHGFDSVDPTGEDRAAWKRAAAANAEVQLQLYRDRRNTPHE